MYTLGVYMCIGNSFRYIYISQPERIYDVCVYVYLYTWMGLKPMWNRTEFQLQGHLEKLPPSEGEAPFTARSHGWRLRSPYAWVTRLHFSRILILIVDIDMYFVYYTDVCMLYDLNICPLSFRTEFQSRSNSAPELEGKFRPCEE